MTQIDALPARIASKISTDAETGCWVWTAARTDRGYGRVKRNKVYWLAHRVVYSLLVGDPGPRLDHRCFNHACVNPEHLRPATVKQNQEHREGAQRNSSTGVRGVSWRKREKKWVVQVGHGGRNLHGGYFADLREAEKAAIALRAKLFTHDDGRFVS